MTVIVGLDLGSRRIGCVAAHEGLPLHVLVADTVEVPVAPRGHRLDLRPVVDQLVARILAGGAERVIIEHAPFYCPATATPKQAAAMAQAHEVCSRIEEGIYRELKDHPVVVESITRARWSHRVVPHTSGSLTDAQANEGLQAHIADGWEKLATQDERDAAGAIVGWLLPAPRKTRKRKAASTGPREPARPKTPEQIEARRVERRAYKTAWQMKARGGSKREAKRAAIAAAIARGSLIR